MGFWGANKFSVQVCLAVIYCFLAAGIVFGFAAIKPVLIRENVYRNLCSPDELEDDVDVCYGQEIRYLCQCLGPGSPLTR